MSKKQNFKTITSATQLLLDSGENDSVDYKRDIKGLKSEDLVAFANSPNGGSILIGVEEIEENGVTIGRVVGCETSDQSRLNIVTKALNCIPPISITVTIENTKENPFFKIVIPESNLKPHCTLSGTYKIRKDNRNSVLTPEELLELFLEKEAKKFNRKFKKATKKLFKNIDSVNQSVSFMESTIVSSIQNISSTLEWTEMEASDAKSTIDSVESYVIKLTKDQNLLQRRVKSILKHHEITDPKKYDHMNEVATQIIKELESNDSLLERGRKGELEFTDSSNFNLTEEEKQLIVKRSIEHIDSKRGKNKDEEE